MLEKDYWKSGILFSFRWRGIANGVEQRILFFKDIKHFSTQFSCKQKQFFSFSIGCPAHIVIFNGISFCATSI